MRFLKTGMAFILLASMLVLIGCAAKFTRTGKTYPPLAENAHVDVIMRAVPEYKVEQVGIITTDWGDLEDQINQAKKAARANGADVIILAELNTRIERDADGKAQLQEVRTWEAARKIVE